MNKYANCLYEYIIENWFSGVTAEADYREAQASRDRAEKALFAVLPPEQEALFCTYLEEETALQALDLRCMFQETLRMLRGLLTV